MGSWVLRGAVAELLTTSQSLEKELEGGRSQAFRCEVPGCERFARALADQNAVSRILSELLEEIDRGSVGSWT